MTQNLEESVLLRITWTTQKKNTDIISMSNTEIDKFNESNKLDTRDEQKMLHLSGGATNEMSEITLYKKQGCTSDEDIFDLAMRFKKQLEQNEDVRKVEIKLTDYTIRRLQEDEQYASCPMTAGDYFCLYRQQIIPSF